MVIQDDCLTYTPGETLGSLLFQAALATRWKEPPRDALDTMVLKTSGQDLSKCDRYRQLEFIPFDPRVKRTEALLSDPDGNLVRITKGGKPLNALCALCPALTSVHGTCSAACSPGLVSQQGRN